jgi:hypothetical protein
MKVELSIKDDRELKNHIRDVIRGEVTSIARGEIREIIKEVFSEKYNTTKLPDAESIVKTEIRDIVKAELKAGSYNESWIKQTAKFEISQLIRATFSKEGI